MEIFASDDIDLLANARTTLIVLVLIDAAVLVIEAARARHTVAP